MKIQETVRKDGLRIISCSIPTQTKVLVSISAMVGSANDPVNEQGLFHYFEHMAFKGTKRRTMKDIKNFSNRNLLSVNATTYRQRTEYYGVAVWKKLALACDFVTDVYVNSMFPVAEIKKEKGPVLLEAARNRDSDGYMADFALREMLYRNNPLRQFGTGTELGVAGITRARLMKEKAQWYVPSNTVALGVGRVSHAEFVREISKRIPLGKVQAPVVRWDVELDEVPSLAHKIIEREDRSKATILVGCKVADRVDDNLEVVEDFLASLLVSGWSSRLWQEVREKRGLAYTAGGGTARYYGLGGYFNAYVETAPGKEAEVEKLIRKALFTPITAQDKKLFEDTRESMNDQITAGMGESLGSWGGLIFDKIMKGEPVSRVGTYLKEQRKIVNSLSLRDAEAMRRRIFLPERFATVIVKPKKK